MTVQKATNVTWHDGVVARSDRERIHGHKGVTLWMTGLSASGKSTIARRVEQLLAERGCFSYVLDGDNVRHGLNKDLGFSPKDRNENIRRIGEVAKPFPDAGATTMTAFLPPYPSDRDPVRALRPETSSRSRHRAARHLRGARSEGLYKKARGQLPEFTGISVLRGAARGRAHAAHRHDGSETCARSMVAYPRRAGDARRHVSARYFLPPPCDSSSTSPEGSSAPFGPPWRGSGCSSPRRRRCCRGRCCHGRLRRRNPPSPSRSARRGLRPLLFG